jgi:hypothetical protein
MGVYELSGAGSLKTARTLYPTMNANNGDNYGAMVPLGFLTSAGSTPTFTFSNIPQIYQDLRFVIFGRTSFAIAEHQVLIRINGDGSAIYSQTRLFGNGTSAISERNTGLTGLYPGVLPGSSATAGIYGTLTMDILNYANTSTFKTTIARNASDLNGSGSTRLGIQLWRSTSAITSLVVQDVDGSSWASGSTVGLYGIRGVSS